MRSAPIDYAAAFQGLLASGWEPFAVHDGRVWFKRLETDTEANARCLSEVAAMAGELPSDA